MCCEDYEIGLHNSGSSRIVSVGTSAGVVAGQNNKRTMLVLNSPISGNVTYSPMNDVTAGVGINISAGNRPVILLLKEHGSIVTKEWFAIHDVTTLNVAIMESEITGGPCNPK